MSTISNCPICGTGRDTDLLGGECPKCYNGLVPVIMKNLPTKLHELFYGKVPEGLTWRGRPGVVTLPQAKVIAYNRVEYAKQIEEARSKSEKKRLEDEFAAKEDEITERIYGDLLNGWRNAANAIAEGERRRNFLNSALSRRAST